jgi:hypothetical protein
MIKDAAEVVAPGPQLLEAEAEHLGLRSTWPASWRSRAERESQLRIVGAPDDLFEYQSTSQGGWVMPGDAGRAV